VWKKQVARPDDCCGVAGWSLLKMGIDRAWRVARGLAWVAGDRSDGQ
jgi:hypothetical protein